MSILEITLYSYKELVVVYGALEFDIIFYLCLLFFGCLLSSYDMAVFLVVHRYYYYLLSMLWGLQLLEAQLLNHFSDI